MELMHLDKCGKGIYGTVDDQFVASYEHTNTKERGTENSNFQHSMF